eukprot:Amastigsp_a4588_90.p2 type:complete len:155 gc:universal Amastigsp_a4588_90:523-59(-)
MKARLEKVLGLDGNAPELKVRAMVHGWIIYLENCREPLACFVFAICLACANARKVRNSASRVFEKPARVVIADLGPHLCGPGIVESQHDFCRRRRCSHCFRSLGAFGRELFQPLENADQLGVPSVDMGIRPQSLARDLQRSLGRERQAQAPWGA